MIVLLGFGIFYSCLSPEQGEKKEKKKEECCKMRNVKIIFRNGFLSPIFWTALFQIKIQVIAQCLRFVIFHLCNPEDDGTNTKCCQSLCGHYLDPWKCAQCFPGVKSQKKPPWDTMWCCLLWPRLTKMKDLSEHGLFKAIQVFYMCMWKRKCGVCKGTSWASACVFVCPDRISRVKLVWLFEPSF